MKEKTTQASVLSPTLEDVRCRFETWRSRKKTGSRIPKALWKAAVEQCQPNSILEVSRTLRLNYTDLKDRVHESKKVALPSTSGCVDFVKLDFEGQPRPLECIIEMEAANGAKLRMHFLGQQKGIDPVDLTRAFLRQGS
jgi:signal recognition particle subunit SEC65